MDATCIPRALEYNTLSPSHPTELDSKGTFLCRRDNRFCCIDQLAGDIWYVTSPEGCCLLWVWVVCFARRWLYALSSTCFSWSLLQSMPASSANRLINKSGMFKHGWEGVLCFWNNKDDLLLELYRLGNWSWRGTWTCGWLDLYWISYVQHFS